MLIDLCCFLFFFHNVHISSCHSVSIEKKGNILTQCIQSGLAQHMIKGQNSDFLTVLVQQ